MTHAQPIPGDSEEEVWLPVPEYEGRYEVSSIGRVKSLARSFIMPNGKRRTIYERVLVQFKNPAGYFTLTLALDAVYKNQSVNRLVCAAFHGAPPSPTHHAAHLNGVRDDNREVNLAWKTPLENISDKERHGTMPRGELHCAAKLSDDDAEVIRSMYGTGSYSKNRIAKQFGVSATQVSDIIAGKYRSLRSDQFRAKGKNHA